jgi:hypothetical protein
MEAIPTSTAVPTHTLIPAQTPKLTVSYVGPGQREQFLITSRATGDGYIVEPAVPRSVVNLSPSGNERFGCVFSISDDDRPGKNVQKT